MGTPLKERNRAEFKRYKEDVHSEGKSFFPYAILHDSIMSLVVVAVIIGLACVWYFTADGTEAGLLGPLYTDEADPGTIAFVPRPGLVLLLPLLSPPDLQVAGDGRARHGRDPDDPPDPPDRPPLLRSPARTADQSAPGRRRRRDPRRDLDGRAHVEGSHREGGPRLRADRGGQAAGVGGAAGLRRQPDRGRRRDALRAVRLPQLPHVPR